MAVRTKTSWYGIRIFFSEWGDISTRGRELTLKKDLTKGVDLVQSGHHRHHVH
jgi:hypothetical protein